LNIILNISHRKFLTARTERREDFNRLNSYLWRDSIASIDAASPLWAGHDTFSARTKKRLEDVQLRLRSSTCIEMPGHWIHKSDPVSAMGV
jgi:hypothetical protein